MSSMRCLAIALGTLLITVRSSATPESETELSAEDAPDARSKWFSDRPLKVHGRAGIGTPTGLIGGALTLDLHDRAALGVGAGTNLQGLQLAALTRFRPLIWQGKHDLLRAVAIELAFSVGPGRGGVLPAVDGGEGNGLSYTWNRIAWVQLEGQYEILEASGVSFLAGIGLAFPVAHSEPPICRASREDVTCNAAEPPNGPSLTTSISGAVGYAF